MRLKKRFSFVLSLSLLLMLSWQLAQLMWQLIAPADVVSVSPTLPQSAISSSSTISFFGSAQASERSTVSVAADAKLLQNWQLLGTVLDGKNALALVQMGEGMLRWVTLGERLDNGLVVMAVLPNELQLLTTQGVRSLFLFTKITTNVTAAPSTQTTSAKTIETNSNLQAVRAKLQQNPMQAMQLMQMEPVWSNGKLQGLSLKPQAGQETLFNQLGLKSGDVLVGLNGEPVGAWMNKMALLPKVLDNSGARINLLRSGIETELIVKW
jgi:type II secretion system protein C